MITNVFGFIFRPVVLKYIDMNAIGLEQLKKIKLSCNVLKIIACVSMFVDHIGSGIIHNYLKIRGMELAPSAYTTLQNTYECCKGFGRLAFPIFAFFLVEGFLRTRNVKKYAIRLGIFALISEIPFDYGMFGSFFYMEHQNVILSLFIALIMLIVIRYLEGNVLGLSNTVKYLALICTVIAFADIAYLLKTDYTWKCMLLTAVLYFFRSAGPFRLIAGAASMCWEKYAPASFVLLYFYDPEQKPRFKYAFYVFYPLHLIIIGIIARLLIYGSLL